MAAPKTFVLYNASTGLPISGRTLRLKDNAGLLSDVEMEEAATSGVYNAVGTVPDGYWKVFDITAGTPGTDTGYRMDVGAFLTREPAISTGNPLHFYAGNKVFRQIEIEDVDGLAAALSDEESAREAAVSAETSARSAAVTTLQSQIDAIGGYATHTPAWQGFNGGEIASPSQLVVTYDTPAGRKMVGRIRTPASAPSSLTPIASLRIPGAHGFIPGDVSIGWFWTPTKQASPSLHPEGDWTGIAALGFEGDDVQITLYRKTDSGTATVNWRDLNTNTDLHFTIEAMRSP